MGKCVNFVMWFVDLFEFNLYVSKMWINGEEVLIEVC